MDTTYNTNNPEALGNHLLLMQANLKEQLRSILNASTVVPPEMAEKLQEGYEELKGLAGELIPHRLSYLHPAALGLDHGWQTLAHNPRGYIEAVRMLRTIHGYDLRPAHDLVKACRDMKYAYANHPHLTTEVKHDDQ